MNIPPPPAVPPRIPGDDEENDGASLTGEIFASRSDRPEGQDLFSASDTVDLHRQNQQLAAQYWAPTQVQRTVSPSVASPMPDASSGAQPGLQHTHVLPAEPVGQPGQHRYPETTQYPVNEYPAARLPVSQPRRPQKGAQSAAPSRPGDQLKAKRRGSMFVLFGGVALFALLIGALIGMAAAPSSDRTANTGSNTQAARESSPGSESEAGSGSGPDGQAERFTSPSGNISCQISQDGSARCDIRDASFDPPEKPADCSGAFGKSITAASNTVQFTCVTDPVDGSDAPELGYGQKKSVKGVTCSSAKTGMTCTSDATGRGFTLAKQKYEIF
ncbi:hypothetical protein LWF01_06290 [Saxibacter everestensis]|uniref:Uncharacterized protein n=1 Tax=Saxibacter everestensis TaxID=2909229 RepID=A0ABY8QX35_9MICO|nr:hypothetical protein LWF01_06290 [Brevibacteriaceae bacterium ZFBP1038]